MKTYTIYIKSHADMPDYEQEITAQDRTKAIERFYNMLEGEFDREFIDKNIEEEI